MKYPAVVILKQDLKHYGLDKIQHYEHFTPPKGVPIFVNYVEEGDEPAIQTEDLYWIHLDDCEEIMLVPQVVVDFTA